MKRPYLISFTAIASDKQIAIRASVTKSYTPMIDSKYQQGNLAQSPIQSIRLIHSEEFRIKIIGLSDVDETLMIREFDSDSFGNFNIVFNQEIGNQLITKLNIYEVSDKEGLSLHLGSFIPQKINNPKKIIISDFDKTLCDTKFSNAKEVIKSLRTPLINFPTIEKSVYLLKKYIEDEFQPFILSASPHFYSNAIRDWLYQNKIYDGNIFLKDYRSIFSISDGILTPKDVKQQGFYKLNQLVNILNMTGVPNKLVLMGDGFETDQFIYLILHSIIKEKVDPWHVWNQIKTQKAFKLTTKQTFQFLNQFYQLSQRAKKIDDIEFEIYIRCTDENFQRCKLTPIPYSFLEKNRSLIHYFLA